ncbi:hypothetical protein ANI02nite_27400 [Acetobacter nitrogenifigens DSM 23921 = NBRC 105050]|uniref:Uncharacterized protein n=2 Tax=Acetobacter nitrogenifigens TaxID=285268 RepID=A0A511XD19_9PROT|nr:hypothetical protein ANI02nite_27400 [Acetobacter nitrogenifigens DSM 23921 = NBRC 105050]
MLLNTFLNTPKHPWYEYHMKRINPYSRPDAVAKLDGRSKEARLVKETRRELLAHLGKKPTVTQIALVERVAWIRLHLSLLDRKMAGTAPGERDARQYLAWTNTMAKLLTRLGLDQPEHDVAPIPSLDSLLASRRASA